MSTSNNLHSGYLAYVYGLCWFHVKCDDGDIIVLLHEEHDTQLTFMVKQKASKAVVVHFVQNHRGSDRSGEMLGRLGEFITVEKLNDTPRVVKMVQPSDLYQLFRLGGDSIAVPADKTRIGFYSPFEIHDIFRSLKGGDRINCEELPRITVKPINFDALRQSLQNQ